MKLLRILTITIAPLLIAPHGARADDAAGPGAAESVMAPVTTQHSIAIGGEVVEYAATWGQRVLENAQGEPQATISSTAYVREKVGDPSRRPVMFLFNGGPGASSSPLHFEAFGPRLRTDGSFVDNGESPLDAVDLVFIDPVGTGFSRVLPGGDGSRYFSVVGDAEAVLALIRGWLDEHGRTTSPLYIAGESYGGTRLAVMMQHLDDLEIAGLLLISPMLDPSGSSSAAGNDRPYIDVLPSMAAAAWYHERIDRADRSVEELFEEAARFARTDYALALWQGADLPAKERERIAARMSELIGLPAETIIEADLRLGAETFRKALLKDQGLVAGRLDARVTGPIPKAPPDRPSAANDPALGLGPTNVILSESIARYLRDELGVSTARDYVSLTLDVNFQWDWSGDWAAGSGFGPSFYINTTPHIAALMKRQPGTRVLLVGGRYDLATPLLASRYAITHGGVPLERVSELILSAGHSPYETGPNRERLSEAVRAFVLGSGQPAASGH